MKPFTHRRIQKLSLCWEPKFLWVGATWKISVDLGRTHRPVEYHLYLCLVPCLPIVLIIERWRE